jgi:hypothetical protein
LFATAFVALFVQGAAARDAAEYDLGAIARNLNEYKARLLAVEVRDGTCKQAFGLTEADGEGEHAIYGSIQLLESVRLKFRVRALTRYAIQLGFTSGDWTSYAVAQVSLISGAYTNLQGGYLQVRDVTVQPEPGGWRAIELQVTNVNRAKQPSAAGHAFVKLIADGDSKSYLGRAGYGVELCADGR